MGYARFLDPRWKFDLGTQYPVGTILVNDDVRFDANWNQIADFSHVAMVSTPPDADENQLLIQSDHVDGITEWTGDGYPLRGKPGVNEDRTMADTIQVIYVEDVTNDNADAKQRGFFWAGAMPDVGLEPW
jgi:hypothetical protein